MILPAAVGDHRAGRAVRDVAQPGVPAGEVVVQRRRAAGLLEQLRPHADQAARRDAELEAHAARALVEHLDHAAAAWAEQPGHRADVVLRHVDQEGLHRLVDDAVDGLGHDLRLADAELVALAAHGLDQDRELELAAAGDLERLRPVGGSDADRDVRQRLALEPLAQLARGDVAPVAAGERRVVDREAHRDGGLLDRDRRQRQRALDRGDGLADRHFADAGEHDDLAGLRLGDLDALEAAVRVEPGHLGRDRGPVEAAERRPAGALAMVPF